MQSMYMNGHGSNMNMLVGVTSATTISNKSTSAGGTVGLWKNSSKLMRDPDQIGSQMMNGNKQLLGANNSSTLFSNGLMNNSAGGGNGGKLPMES